MNRWSWIMIGLLTALAVATIWNAETGGPQLKVLRLGHLRMNRGAVRAFHLDPSGNGIQYGSSANWQRFKSLLLRPLGL